MASVRLFLCGDVMTGRGIDHVLPHPSRSELREEAIDDASGYVQLAERVSGPIPRSAGYDYVWGDALAELAKAAPDTRIVNLETSVTRSDDWEPKGINYRMHPGNVECLTCAGIDCCVLANNHVLDFGRRGLEETLETLHLAGLETAGAGRGAAEASAPAVLSVSGGARVLVVGVGFGSSGIPPSWAATESRSGVNLVVGDAVETARAVRQRLDPIRQPGDVAVASVHWGPNWGFEIPWEQSALAHALVDEAGVDVVHGHSSHHVKGIEVYRGKLILYGCGDFINDYEGIGTSHAYRGDLALMYFPILDTGSGALRGLRMVPLRMHRFRLERASAPDTDWLAETLSREGARLGTGVELASDGALELSWAIT
jgi:poly-gamma-glutamate capsule biosynthesis protein CapA/YwtB (metallophosphatase superfamily)